MNKPILFSLLLLSVSCLYLLADRVFSVHLPDNAMLLVIDNRSDQVLDVVEIKHGNASSQEIIIQLQIYPYTQRQVVLNHQPGKGFNFSVLSGGEKTEVCVGKFSQSRVLREIIHRDGSIEEQDIKLSW